MKLATSHISKLLSMLALVSIGHGQETILELGDDIVVFQEEELEAASRFDELMQEAHLIFVEAIIADKTMDTLETAFNFDLLFEAMSDIEQLPLLDELQRLEFNRFLNATISYYETDSQTLEKIETALTVSALRDELSRYTRSFPVDLGPVISPDVEEGHLPITHNAHVARIINFFTTQGHRNMQIWLNRLPRYRKIIEPILLEEGMPPELIFLALVESGLNPRAYSWKHASGPWQFISSTGRRYGLERDWWRDERRDIEKSTLAATRYLTDLHDEFGDWYLAMAAYNSGEGRVRRAVRVHQTRDYWKLYVLPRQTRNYIPNIMAAFLIAQDPEKYGFTISPQSELEWDVVRVDRSLTFEILGQIAECDPDTFLILNPELRQRATPPPDDSLGYPFRIPLGHAQAFAANYTAIASQVGPVLADVQIRRHVVRKGETLYSISKRYGVSMDRIAKANNLRNWHRLYRGQRLEIPVTSSTVTSRQTAAVQRRNTKRQVYTVRKGDTLSEIAERFRVRDKTLRQWNGFRPNSENIYVGQKLVVWAPAKPKPSRIDPVVPDTTGLRKSTYTVKTGESLGFIAEAHAVGLSKLRQWNGLRSNDQKIFAGQNLTIWVPRDGVQRNVQRVEMPAGMEKQFYVVRPGDTLSQIAEDHNVGLSVLMGWNGMTSRSTIRVGQQLIILRPAG